jgi:hypothetical protein
MNVAEQYFDAIQHELENLEGAAQQWLLDLEGVRVRICVLGKALCDTLVRAMPLRAWHRAMQVADADRVLWAIDTREFPLSAPAGIVNPHEFSVRGEVHSLSAGDVLTLVGANPPWLGMVHQRSSLGFYITPSAQSLPSWAQAAPMRETLHLMTRSHAGMMMHAAVLGMDGCGVLLAGKGGSGKSTTSLLGLMHGLQFAGDDYVHCAKAGADWCGHTLYDTAKVKPQSLQLFPMLIPMIERLSNDTEQKWVVFARRHFPSQMASSLCLKAILLPRIGNGTATNLTPARASDAVWALAPTTTAQMPFAGIEVLTLCKQMANDLPAFWLDLGSDAEGIVAVLKDMLERLKHE